MANLDPSHCFDQCAPGSDARRLRSDQSGYENLVLADEWTDKGLNAGCIEERPSRGRHAANVVLGRFRRRSPACAPA
jgi:hypothetical protein